MSVLLPGAPSASFPHYYLWLHFVWTTDTVIQRPLRGHCTKSSISLSVRVQQPGHQLLGWHIPLFSFTKFRKNASGCLNETYEQEFVHKTKCLWEDDSKTTRVSRCLIWLSRSDSSYHHQNCRTSSEALYILCRLAHLDACLYKI